MLAERDLFKLLGSFVASEVQKQVERQLQPLLTAIDTLQKQVAQCEAKETAARLKLDGIDKRIDGLLEPDDLTDVVATAKTEMTEWTREYVTGALYALPKPDKGEPGKDGADGRDGADGKSLCLDDVRSDLNRLVTEAVLNLPVPVHPVSGFIDRDGHLHFTYSDGSTRAVGPVVGRDGAPGPPGRDGVDGLGIEQIEFDGERTLTLANEKITKTFILPHTIYQGLWKAERKYVRGDEVTIDGSQWIAMRETDKLPGTLDSGWVLACKRGAAGKDLRDRAPNNPAAMGKR